MSSLITFLTSLGLSTTEATIYVSGLKKPSTVHDFVENAGIKRSTIYHALHTLEAKGLTSARKESGQIRYYMAPPESLQEYIAYQTHELEQQQVVLEKMLPLFPATETTQNTYVVERYDSITGVKKIIDKALRCESRQWRIIAPRQNFFSEYDAEYAEYYLSKRRAHKIKAKTLWEAPDQISRKGSLTFGEILSREPRYLPPKYRGQFVSVIIMFDDSIAFISSLKASESLLITSPDFSSTMNVMFDALWSQSKEFLQIP